MAKGRHFNLNWLNVRLRAARKHAHRCKEIEDLTKHRVTISTSMPADGRVNDQFRSPLFRLSTEIRLVIYKLVLNYDDTVGFSTDEDGGPAPYASLLLTCRIVWIEANILPIALAIHNFNFAHGSPKPISNDGTLRAHLTQQAYLNKSQQEGLRMQKFFTCLTPLNRIDLEHTALDVNHITLAEWRTSESLVEMLGKRPIYTKILTLRIRGADWGPLRDRPVEQIDSSWLTNLFEGDYLSFVQSFKLELLIEFDDITRDRDADKAHFVAVAKCFSQIDGLNPDSTPIITEFSKTEGKGRSAVERNYCTTIIDWTNTKLWPLRELVARAMTYDLRDSILNRKFKERKPRGGGNRTHVVADRWRKKDHKRKQKQQLKDEENNPSLRKQRFADQQARLQIEK